MRCPQVTDISQSTCRDSNQAAGLPEVDGERRWITSIDLSAIVHPTTAQASNLKIDLGSWPWAIVLPKGG
jgi:hypothetical protein